MRTFGPVVALALAAILRVAAARAQEAASSSPPPQPLPSIPVGRPALARAELYLEPNGLFDTVTLQPAATATMQTVGGGGTLGGTFYLRPVVDDDAPIPLQSFLQRAPEIGLVLYGSSTRQQSSNGMLTTPILDTVNAGASLGFDVYAHPRLALWGSFGFDYTRIHDDNLEPRDFSLNRATLDLPVHTGFGIRLHDTRIDLGYGIGVGATGSIADPLRSSTWGRFDVGFMEGLEATVRTVFLRRLEFAFVARAVPSGVTTSAAFESFVTRTLGIFGSLSGHLAVFTPNTITSNAQIASEIGVEDWFTPRVGTSLRYSLTCTAEGVAVLDNVLAAMVRLRL